MVVNRNLSGDATLNAGDILLFARGVGINSLISVVTKSPYYHVALVKGATEIVEARPKGVEVNDLRSRKGGHTYRSIPTPLSDTQSAAALRWALAQVGDGYDTPGAIAMLLDRMFVHLHINAIHGDRFTCGEFVALAYRDAGYTLFADIAPEDVEPADFARLLATDREKAVE